MASGVYNAPLEFTQPRHDVRSAHGVVPESHLKRLGGLPRTVLRREERKQLPPHLFKLELNHLTTHLELRGNTQLFVTRSHRFVHDPSLRRTLTKITTTVVCAPP